MSSEIPWIDFKGFTWREFEGSELHLASQRQRPSTLRKMLRLKMVDDIIGNGDVAIMEMVEMDLFEVVILRCPPLFLV